MARPVASADAASRDAAPPLRVGGRRAEIWLGDAVRAFGALQPDGGASIEVLQLLGLRGVSHPAAAATPAIPVPVVETRRPIPDRPAPATAEDVAARLRPAWSPMPYQPALPPEIEPEPDGVTATPPRRLPSLADVLPPARPHRPAPNSLLRPGQQRAIVASLASRRDHVGDVDTELLVRLLAERRPIPDLPRLPAFTTRRGLQLLLDHGEGMSGFQRDRDEVAAVVSLVAGTDGLEVLRFARSPLDEPGAGDGPKWTWQPYRVPATGRPVLVVSDLGTGYDGLERLSVVARWAETAQMLRVAGCPVAALVPAPLHRVAPELHAAMGIVSWDRTTGVRDAIAAIRRAGRRLPEEDPW
jgi:hypothetical protein